MQLHYLPGELLAASGRAGVTFRSLHLREKISVAGLSSALDADQGIRLHLSITHRDFRKRDFLKSCENEHQTSSTTMSSAKKSHDTYSGMAPLKDISMSYAWVDASCKSLAIAFTPCYRVYSDYNIHSLRSIR